MTEKLNKFNYFFIVVLSNADSKKNISLTYSKFAVS